MRMDDQGRDIVERNAAQPLAPVCNDEETAMRGQVHIIGRYNATKAKAPIFDAELRQYDAYAAMDLYGLTLEEVEAQGVANAEKPRQYAAEIL